MQYVDDEVIDALDEEPEEPYGDEEVNDFETFKESEMAEGDEYEEG